ncbi:MAG: hypothetical protein M3066_20205 [Actinomycetota bacterium]|nr:hypothetical protein [Actinomycetota bacterium]
MKKHPAVTVALLVVAALTATACGGGKGTATPATTTTPTTVDSTAGTTPTTTPGTDAALVAKAKSAVFQPGDFPAGFEAQPDDPTQGLGIDTVWSELTTCLGVPSTATPAGRATSATFKMGLATQGRATVEYTTEAMATADAAALTGPKAQDCLTKAFAADVDRSKPEGATPGPVMVAPSDVTVAGKKALSWRINATVNLQDLVVPLFQDFIVIVNKGTVVRMMFLQPGSPFPQTLEHTLEEAVVSRA